MYRDGAFDAFADEKCPALKNMPEARYIFDCILSDDAVINAMIEATKEGEPALSACIHRIESFINTVKAPQFGLDADNKKFDKNRQFLGKMVANIMREYGYVSDEEKPVRQETSTINTAMRYKFDPASRSCVCVSITVPCK